MKSDLRVREKFPKDAKLRKKLAECLANDGWTQLDICLLLGYSLKKFRGFSLFTSFQLMCRDDSYRFRMAKYFLEKYDIRAEISK